MTQLKNHPYNIGVLGAGSWGTALAILLSKNGHSIFLWEFREDAAKIIAAERENMEFLPGVPIPADIVITSRLEEAVTKKDLLVFAIPSHILREVARAVSEVKTIRSVIAISVAKGIENNSLMRMSQILIKEIPWLDQDRIGVLSGPSHAEEVSRNIPTAVVAASSAEYTAQLIQRVFMNKHFRVYTSRDVIGVELGGALKNVIAIAAGICDGAGFGDNTKAALQPRGLVEIVRLGVQMGANPLTFAGLSGMGDLIVTCMSKYSRNRYLGHQIGKGRSLQQALKKMVMVAEGVRTTRSARELAELNRVDMPITHEVYHILFDNKDPKAAMEDLMSRDPKIEVWG